jgi:hypothetical protein
VSPDSATPRLPQHPQTARVLRLVTRTILVKYVTVTRMPETDAIRDLDLYRLKVLAYRAVICDL